MNIENLWDNFLIKIKEQITSLSFDTWFSNTKLYSLENKCATVIVPTIVHKKHLSENYSELIEEIFNELTQTLFNIEYILEEEIKNNTTVDIEGVPSYNNEQTNLNIKYTFNTFVVGDSNKFAHAASLAIAENPGKVYNPLFIYGNSGLGKTHLMHAVGNHIIKNSNKKVLYVTSEQFISDFLEINKKDNKGTNYSAVEFFKRKYRTIDVLLIDDIQFLGNTTVTQQEFFHTFNKLYDDNKQIIISSDRSVDDLKVLEDRLRTRFSWGLTVNIFPPDINLRREILKNKISNQNLVISIPDDVIEYIASNLTTDVRQLEGAITRIYAYATMFNKSIIDLNLAREALKDNFNKYIDDKNIIHKIQRIVSDYYKINIDDLKSKKRTNNITYPRQVAMYLCRVLSDETYPKIGIEFGGRDHSTVIHSFLKIEEELLDNEELNKIITNLMEKCR